MKNIDQKAIELWALDLRALAVFRIGAGVFLLISTLGESITESYLTPRWTLEILFRIALTFFVLGWHTSVVKVLVWGIFSFKLFEQMGGGFYGFKILSTMLFWSLFLPLGARYSVDSYRAPASSEKRPNVFLSYATVGALVQLALIYFSGGITKSLECWLIDGGALRSTLYGPTGYAPFAVYLLPHEWLLRLLSRGVYLAEVVGPLLLFIPEFTARMRVAVAAVFISMHLGIAVFMDIGVFPYLCVFVWVLVLPAVFWDFAEHSLLKVRVQSPGVFSGNSVYTQTSRLAEWLALVALVFVIVSVLEQWFGIMGPEVYRVLRLMGLVIGLDQRWIMYNDPCGTWPVDN